MDIIQATLIKAGRKDLAQQYYKKSTWMISVDDDHLLNEYKKEKKSLEARIEYCKKQINEVKNSSEQWNEEEKNTWVIKEYNIVIEDNKNRLNEIDKIIKNWKN